MKLAPISAPQWANRLQKGDYHMVIAPWLFSVGGYAQYYSQSARPPETYVMLDNGAFQKASLSSRDLARAVAIARADEVVLPDVLQEAGETLRASYEALQVMQEDEALAGVMFVPQGKTKEEWRQCLEAWIAKWEKGNYYPALCLCIGLTSNRQGPRWRSWAIQIGAAAGYPMHLLGLPDVEEFIHAELPQASGVGVRGIDTSLPFALACSRQLLTPTSKKENLQKPEQYAQLGQRTITLAKLNTAILRYWLEAKIIEDWVPIEVVRRIAATTSDSRRIYSSPEFALRMCAVPRGRYDIRRVDNRITHVRPLGEGQKPQGDVVGVYYGGKPTRQRLF